MVLMSRHSASLHAWLLSGHPSGIQKPVFPSIQDSKIHLPTTPGFSDPFSNDFGITPVTVAWIHFANQPGVFSSTSTLGNSGVPRPSW